MDCCSKRRVLGLYNSFPKFSMEALIRTAGGEDNIETLTNEDIAGRRTVIFFYPLDFTFVCPTELIELNDYYKDIQQYAEIITVSVDSVYSHQAWKGANPNIGKISFPMASDLNHNLSRQLGILKNQGYCERATYIIDEEGNIQWMEIFPDKVGRSSSNLLRVLQAISSDKMCAASWTKGDAHILG